jgi:hypothetical protein
MPNVLDPAPIAALTRKMAAKIPHAGAAARFAKLAFEEMVNEKRNFRAARPDELPPEAVWARREVEAGREVAVFQLNRAVVTRLRRTARALADTCAELDHFEPIRDGLSARQRTICHAAAEFIAKIDRASFEILAARARVFARERKRRLDEEKATLVLFVDAEICAAPGRVWRRIVSVSALWAVGREFRNCLARRTINGYGTRLRNGSAEFWVLRDQTGKGLMVAMACGFLGRITEVRGPRNRPVSSDDPDLAHLAEARAWSRSNGRTSARVRPPDHGAIRETLIELLRARSRAPN